MKTMMKHRKNFLYLVFCGVFSALVVLHPGYADDDDTGCQYFSPAFVLCSVHSHNVGYTSSGKPANPTESEQVAAMNEVIALKSTVIAQQLKKQYDALNAVIKRFKTQLEKAVLKSKMELITGDTSSSSGYGSSSSSYSSGGGLAGAEDCAFATYERVFDCLGRNMRLIQQEADRNLTNARKQLEKDIMVMDDEKLCESDGSCNKVCKDGITTKDNIKKCAATLYRRVSQRSEENENERMRSRYGGK